jgi:hypothetical protein
MSLGCEEDPKVLRVWEGVCVRLDQRVALNPGTVPELKSELEYTVKYRARLGV